jgi:hypothetical protein
VYAERFKLMQCAESMKCCTWSTLDTGRKAIRGVDAFMLPRVVLPMNLFLNAIDRTNPIAPRHPPPTQNESKDI